MDPLLDTSGSSSGGDSSGGPPQLFVEEGPEVVLAQEDMMMEVDGGGHDEQVNVNNHSGMNNNHGNGNSSFDLDVSRSGRIRKKNSFLQGYESTDVTTEKPKKKSVGRPKSVGGSAQKGVPKLTLKLDGGIAKPASASNSKKYSKRPFGKKSKRKGKAKTKDPPPDLIPLSVDRSDLDLDDEDLSDLRMDLPPEFDDMAMPILAAEEIIDGSLLDGEDEDDDGDERLELPDNSSSASSSSRLKSQAQSTYMLEKSVDKKSKYGALPHTPSFPVTSTNSTSPGHRAISSTSTPNNNFKSNHAPTPTNSKTPTTNNNNSKEKPNRRVTAYVLWVRDQKSQFLRNQPDDDFAQFSKSLPQVWAGLPELEKMMWKSKAVKSMKSSGVNIKNSAPAKIRGILKGPSKRKPKPPPKLNPPDHSFEYASTKQLLSSSQESLSKSSNLKSTKKSKSKKSPLFKTTGKAKGKKSTKRRPGRPRKYNIDDDNTFPTKVSPSTSKYMQSLPTTSRTLNGSPEFSMISPTSKGSPSQKRKLESPKVTSLPKQKKKVVKEKDESPHVYKVTGTSALVLAAHFNLLGNCLTELGEKLKEHSDQPFSESKTVLFDSLLCALGTLACVTQHVPMYKGAIPEETQLKILDTIAYVMPGIPWY